MFEYFFYGTILRLGQTVVYASMWVVIGFLIAAVFRCMLGPEKVRTLFGDGTRRGILTGWLIGMLLPVCSLGVIPIVQELRRSGVKGGTIIAFALTAPLFNPLSVLYGLTLSDPIAIICFSLCALIIVSILGLLWDRFFATPPVATTEELPTPGIKRITAVGYTMAKEMTGAAGGYIIFGILCSVFIAVIFQKGYLQGEVEHDKMFAPVTVAAIALPIYSTPLLAMSQIGGMFQHGNSIGAAFSLLILGAGTNMGLVALFIRSFGWQRTLAFLAMLAVTTITLAYVIDKPLYPKGVDPAGHSHAFDVYNHPFHYGEDQLAFLSWHRMMDFLTANEFGGTVALLGVLLIGFASRMFNGKRLEPWLASENKSAGVDVNVPDWILGATVVSGLVAASIAGAYLYYPEPDELLAEMFNENSECVLESMNEQWEGAEKRITFADDLSRRLEVGVFLRQGSVDEFKSAKAKTYREKLDLLKQAVEQRDPHGIKELAMDVSWAYTRMSCAFKDQEPPEYCNAR